MTIENGAKIYRNRIAEGISFLDKNRKQKTIKHLTEKSLFWEAAKYVKNAEARGIIFENFDFTWVGNENPYNHMDGCEVVRITVTLNGIEFVYDHNFEAEFDQCANEESVWTDLLKLEINGTTVYDLNRETATNGESKYINLTKGFSIESKKKLSIIMTTMLNKCVMDQQELVFAKSSGSDTLADIEIVESLKIEKLLEGIKI